VLRRRTVSAVVVTLLEEADGVSVVRLGNATVRIKR
jgi:hypothetical protein